MAELLLPNAPKWVTGRVRVIVAGRGEQMPHIYIPDGFKLALLASPTNAGLIYIAPSRAEATNLDTASPLLPNQPASVQVQNAAFVCYSGTVAGDYLHYMVEQA